MVTAEELTVAIKSTGVSETRQDLEGVEESMQDTAESAGGAADDLEGFSQKFKGAMSAAVAGLVAGAAGLLSQVPVVGEAFSGLSAIVDALILKIDDDLRPSMNGFTQDLFDVANAVNDSEGTFDGLRTAIEGVDQAVEDATTERLQQEIESLTGITIPQNWLDLGWEVITADTRGAVDQLKENVRELPQDLGTIAGSISPALGRGYDKAIQRTRGFVDGFIKDIKRAPNQAASEFNSLSERLSQWAGNIADDARSWGTNIIQRIIDGLRAKINELRSRLDDLRNIGGGINITIPDIGGFGGGNGGGGGGGSGRFRPFGGGGNTSGGVTLDGRDVSESTGRYRADPGRRRGL